MTVHGINNMVFKEMRKSMLCYGIHASLFANVYKLNYQKTTIIQQYLIPILMNGKDIIACIQSGAGKTVSTYYNILL